MNIFWKSNYNFTLINSENNVMVEKADILLDRIKDNFPDSNSNSFNTSTPDELFINSINNKHTLYVVFWSLYMIWEFLKFVWK